MPDQNDIPFDFSAPSVPVPPQGVDTPEQAYDYACEQQFNAVGTHMPYRCPEVEPLLLQSVRWAYYYASIVLKARWPEAEPIIKRNKYVWRTYCIRFGLTESEEIPDLDMDALHVPKPRTLEDIAAQEGLEYSPQESNGFDTVWEREQGNLFVQMRHYRYDNSVVLKAVVGPDRRIGTVEYSDDELDAIANTLHGILTRRVVIETEIPDLDTDPLSVPEPRNWQEVLSSAGLSESPTVEGWWRTSRSAPTIAARKSYHSQGQLELWAMSGRAQFGTKSILVDDTNLNGIRAAVKKLRAWLRQAGAALPESEVSKLAANVAHVLLESDEIPDLDMDALSMPRTWEDVCKEHGLKLRNKLDDRDAAHFYSLHPRDDTEHDDVMAFKIWGDRTVHVERYVPGAKRVDVWTVPEHDLDELSYVLDKMIGDMHAAAGGTVAESEEIPDLDVDLLAHAPSVELDKMCKQFGLEYSPQRSNADYDVWMLKKGRGSMQVFHALPDIAVDVIGRVDNGTVYHSRVPGYDLSDVHNLLMHASNRITLSMVESEQIPDLDADPLACPEPDNWKDVCMRRGMQYDSGVRACSFLPVHSNGARDVVVYQPAVGPYSDLKVSLYDENGAREELSWCSTTDLESFAQVLDGMIERI